MSILFTATLWPFLSSLFISAVSIPVIIRVADLKQLMDEPDGLRKFHSQKTPTLGGVALFIGTLFSFSAFTDYLDLPEVKFIVPSLVLLFFAGIKDDILLLDPWKKLAVQLVCAVLIALFGGLQITNLWGMFGFEEIGLLPGILITLFFIVALINAFNLIDGVNGLAGSLGVVACAFFGIWFVLTGAYTFSILAFSLTGALIGFLIYNFRAHARIFMGDTGSMLVGFIVSILSIKFVENNRLVGSEMLEYYVKAAPGVAIAAMIIPLFDMSRVFALRLLKGKSPLKADRSHIHHVLADLGFSHQQITLSLVAMSFLFIGMSLLLRELRSLEVVLIESLLASLLTGILFFFRKQKQLNAHDVHVK